MSRLIGIMLLGLLMAPGQVWSQAEGGDMLAICFLDLIPPREDLQYVSRAVTETIMNQLSGFPDVSVYPGESAPAKYFGRPDKVLAADKVQLLQIRRETGFDGLIFGEMGEEGGVILLSLHLVDFSSGRIYFSGDFQDRFGSALLTKLEEKIGLYIEALMSYYNCILSVTSEPSGAEVWIDGERVGVTPLDKLDVKHGRSQIRVEMQDYIPFETEVDLRAGQRAMIHTQLYKYSLTATSRPPGAAVYIDDQLSGVTPIKNLVLDKQRFNLRFAKEGFAPYSDPVSLNPGEHAYIHAELYDLLFDHFRNKESPWEIDCHNFSFTQTLEIQDLDEMGVDAFTTSNFQYYAKFGRLSAGVGLGISSLDASQHFDTFLNPGEGYEPFTMTIVKGLALGRYNMVDKVDWLELYLGGFAGFSSATSDQPNAPRDLRELHSTSPLAGGEMGFNVYLTRMLKLSAVAGGYYAGEVEYAVKEASYWGEAKYRRESVGLHPFYLGLSLTLSLWPALM